MMTNPNPFREKTQLERDIEEFDHEHTRQTFWAIGWQRAINKYADQERRTWFWQRGKRTRARRAMHHARSRALAAWKRLLFDASETIPARLSHV